MTEVCRSFPSVTGGSDLGDQPGGGQPLYYRARGREFRVFMDGYELIQEENLNGKRE